MRRIDDSPLIHCITNPISMTQCANAVLGLGARPIMAEHPMEVREITQTADALLLNLGNISDTRMEAMKISFEVALKKDIPVVIDAVGVACSRLRRSFVMELLAKREKLGSKGYLLIKGNYSEIAALFDSSYRAEGVDAKKDISKKQILEMGKELAERSSLVVLASGKTDVVTDGERSLFVGGGSPKLSKITGTGCMLGAIAATFLTAQRDLDAVADACRALKAAGERADKGELGTGSFLTGLLDEISLLRRQKVTREQLKLYLVTDSTGMEEKVFLKKVEDALRGGVTFLQIREKEKSTLEYIELGKKVHEIARHYNVPLVVDDRVDVAIAIDAEGVHLGQSDMPVDVARKLLGDDKIIGATAKTVEQAKKAATLGADYLGVGAIYPTTTKVKTVLTSVDTLRDICEAMHNYSSKTNIYANAIGGLNASNIDVLKGVPIGGICVVSAIMKAEDTYAATRELLKKMEELGIPNASGDMP
jgi:hydroxyethylthiazole kinase/thiamine-phosphate diphosphorylase